MSALDFFRIVSHPTNLMFGSLTLFLNEDEGRFKDDYMEGQGTLKMSQNVIIPKTFDNYYYDSDDMEVDKNVTTSDSKTEEISEKNDWMIPIEFQSDISHIHQKAGFTQVGL